MQIKEKSNKKSKKGSEEVEVMKPLELKKPEVAKFDKNWTLESDKKQKQQQQQQQQQAQKSGHEEQHQGGTSLSSLSPETTEENVKVEVNRKKKSRNDTTTIINNEPEDRIIVGFIAATPIHYKINSAIIETFTVDFLCVHQDLRGKRLAPILMKELSIRLQKLGMSTGSIFSTRTVLNFHPITSPSYYYRPIDIEKLISSGQVKSIQSAERLRNQFKVDFTPLIKCFHTLTEKDIPEALDLMHKEINKRQLGLVLTEEEFYHYFLKFKDIVKTFVVRDPISGELTEMVSFYTHTSSTGGGKQAHLYYIANNMISPKVLMMNTMYIANQFGYDYFFLLDVFGLMRDPEIAAGFIDTGIMKHYYLWNYNIDALHPFYCGMLLT